MNYQLLDYGLIHERSEHPCAAALYSTYYHIYQSNQGANADAKEGIVGAMKATRPVLRS